MKTFKGRLETTDGKRSSAALTVDLTSLMVDVADHRVGTWGFETVEIRRTGSDRFRIDVADEMLLFVADKPIDFAYTVPGWVEDHKPSGRRGIGRRISDRRANLIDRIEQSGGRRRTKKLARSAEHAHTWSEQSLAGGLVRRICVECDHVSIDLRDADISAEIAPIIQADPATA